MGGALLVVDAGLLQLCCRETFVLTLRVWGHDVTFGAGADGDPALFFFSGLQKELRAKSWAQVSFPVGSEGEHWISARVSRRLRESSAWIKTTQWRKQAR